MLNNLWFRLCIQNGGNYRYGFNGKENDDEVKGEGNQQDYGMRIYDPRVGRFLSVDPITAKYPELTPYQFASNKHISSIDIDGLEGWEEVLAGITLYEALFATTTNAVVVAKVVTHTAHFENPSIISLRNMPGSITDKPVQKTPIPANVMLRDIKPNNKPKPDNKPKPIPTSPIVRNDDDPNIVYRSGPDNPNTYTPRPKDIERGKGGEDDWGLSTFRTYDQATQGRGGKAQKIDLNKIKEMGFVVFERDDGHVAIRPMSEDEFKAWAATKGTAVVHYRTVMYVLPEWVKKKNLKLKRSDVFEKFTIC